LEEANEIHEQITRLSAELHDAMMAEATSIQVNMEQAVLAGDSLEIAELVAMEGLLTAWDERFHDWNATVVEVPGMEVDHDHDHGHDHSDHDHGHDHSGHDHGHHSQISLEGMSDAEILSIQEALLAELEALGALFEESFSRNQSQEE
jgi:ABC-type nickel/cobalt efflux system permease component RcnA